MDMSQQDSMKEVQSRQRYEEGAKTYLALLQEVRGVLKSEAPDLKWLESSPKEEDYGYCGDPTAGIDAETGTFLGGSAHGPIPQETWSAARGKIVEIAAQYGFTQVQSVKESPGNIYLTVLDDDGASLEIGSQVNTSIFLYGVCMVRDNPREATPPGSINGSE